MKHTTSYDSPLGPITLASDGEALTGLWFDGQKYDKLHLDPDAQATNDLPVFDQARAWLDAYFAGRDPGALPPCRFEGTDFQVRVWHELEKIPYGQSVTYGDIAAAIAKQVGKAKMSARAVGVAVGHNPISIIVPCHRVVGASGSLTGYGGGIKRKVALLELEGFDMSRFSIPTKGTAL